ncbi:hypothetical protein G3A39_40995 [Paraburkholderia aspalathi]|nr:hypothetical protein [Paraburkholderia aspalathi]
MANNLTLGRGELWFSKFKPGTRTPEGERYIGNSPEFNATIESETLDHFDSDHGVNEKDESITTQTNRSGSLVTDNVSKENIALFFLGSETALTITAETVAAEKHNGVIPGLTYQLGMTALNPSGARNISTDTPAVVTDGDTPATTYVAGTDYVLNADLGRLEIVKGGAIVAGSNITVDYSVEAGTRDRIISGSEAVSGALRYIAFNPVGANFDWYMPFVKLSPNGDYNLKGDEWQSIPFSVEILKNAPMEAIYIDGRPYVI